MRTPVVVLAALTLVSPLVAQQQPERAIRRTIPMTRSIQRGLEAGTRDSTGRPGANYWQLRTDYSIDTRLDPATGIVSGRETVTITNPSGDVLKSLSIRLDQNLFTSRVARSRSVEANTSGMTVTRIRANGKELNADSLSAGWNTTTLVRVALENPIPAGGTGVTPSSSWRSGTRGWPTTTTSAAGTTTRT